MHVNQPHYLPLPLPFFSILVGVFVFLVVLLQVRALRFAYMSIGFSAGGAMLVLLGSLVGSYFNIPVAQLPERHLLSGHHVTFFGMRYVVPGRHRLARDCRRGERWRRTHSGVDLAISFHP